MTLTLFSPAKVNLFLRILSKRPDGYHELASLFQAISLCDTLHFVEANADVLTCDDPAIPTDGSNLVSKAVALFRRKSGWKGHVKVSLEKRIPYEAGLGGGSSNAATTLWALNQLSGLQIDPLDLASWGGEIGSDISFFLSEGTAYCTGRGEILQPQDPLPTRSLWIVKPAQGLSTPAVYKQLSVASLPPRDPQKCLEAFYSGAPEFFNDLEVPAFALMPELLSLKKQLLDSGFEHVVLCGSGSALFCLGSVAPPPMPGTRVYSARFINRPRSAWYTSNPGDEGHIQSDHQFSYSEAEGSAF